MNKCINSTGSFRIEMILLLPKLINLVYYARPMTAYSLVTSVPASPSSPSSPPPLARLAQAWLAAATTQSWADMASTQAATSRAPRRDRVPGSSFHQTDSVTRLMRISVERKIAMRVGLLVMEMARVMVQ